MFIKSTHVVKAEVGDRFVLGHDTDKADRTIFITADARTDGNASHNYVLNAIHPSSPETLGVVQFQYGSVKEHGVNGITNEALLAIVLDRLKGFQSSLYSCRENAIALTKVEEALLWLHSRTRSREQRGVEGTSTK